MRLFGLFSARGTQFLDSIFSAFFVSSFFCFVSDETFCELQQLLQRNEFPKIVAILKPLVPTIYQKSVEFLEDAKWKEFLELEYWMLFLSISCCFLELYKYGFYYLTKVGAVFGIPME